MTRVNVIGEIFENRFGEKFKITKFIESRHGQSRYEVEFIQTGYKTLAYQSNIKKGVVIDKSKKDALCKYKIGQTITNSNGVAALILDIFFVTRKSEEGRKRTRLKIQFLKTEYITECSPDHFMGGKIKDFLSPTVSGVGKLGYVEHIEGKLRDMKEYRIWEGVMWRCYGTDHKSREVSYKDAEVSERWQRFDYFLEDLPKVEGYFKWKKFHEDYPNEKNIYEFDKDTKILGNKLYSLETCQFIHKSINAGFTSWASENTKNKLINKLEEEKMA